MRKVRIANITAEKCSPMGCAISGVPGHRIEDVVLENIRLGFEGGGKPENMERRIEEKPDKYPDCRMFGELPAYGFFCRHVTGLRFSNIALATAAPDPRHAFVFDDAQDVVINSLSVPSTHEASASLFRIRGAQSRNIVIENSGLGDTKNIVTTSPEVPRDAFERK